MPQINVNAPQNVSSWGSKEYIIGFEDDGKIRTTRLNIIQRILRRIFGCYAETHLFSVLSLANKIILKSDLTFADGDALKIMQLYKKKVAKEGVSFFGIFAASYSMEFNGKNVEFSIRYDGGWQVSIYDGSTTYVSFSKSKLPNALQITDFGCSGALCGVGMDDPDFPPKHYFRLFFQHVLQHSSKLEKFCFESQENLSHFIGKDDFVEEKSEEGTFWTLSKDPAGLAEAVSLPPISFDLLLLAS